MLWLAIAHLRGWLQQMVGSTALPTPSAGPVSQVPTTAIGSPCSVETTFPLPHQHPPVSLLASQSNEAVQPITVVRKRGGKTPPAKAATQLKVDGSSQQIPAFLIPQPVKPARKARSKPVKQATSASKATQDKAPVLTPTGKRSGVRGTL